jgi:hypothetical protein
LVNGLLVLAAPLFGAVMGALGGNSDTSAAVYADTQVAVVAGRLMRSGPALLVVLPFALMAAWRTWVHAATWRAGLGSGAQGILEAGVTALVPMLLMLVPGIVTFPLDAPPYVVAYGGLALVAGLAVGMVLWVVARVVLFLVSWLDHDLPIAPGGLSRVP